MDSDFWLGLAGVIFLAFAWSQWKPSVRARDWLAHLETKRTDLQVPPPAEPPKRDRVAPTQDAAIK